MPSITIFFFGEAKMGYKNKETDSRLSTRCAKENYNSFTKVSVQKSSKYKH
jgi:hypothetical protein